MYMSTWYFQTPSPLPSLPPRGLFERHKLLFSFQMCGKILEAASKLNLDEYNFFLRGGIVSTMFSNNGI